MFSIYAHGANARLVTRCHFIDCIDLLEIKCSVKKTYLELKCMIFLLDDISESKKLYSNI